jgi:leucyl-tRNA synthetase
MDMASAVQGVAGAKSLDDVEFGKAAKALRLEIHNVLKQVEYDYSRMQYNTVVSGAMKMINALEDFKALDDAGAKVALIEGFGILLRVLYPATPHLAHVLWSELGYANHLGDLLDAPGRRSTPRPWCRTRSRWCCRSTASCAVRSWCPPQPTRLPSRRLRWPMRSTRSLPKAAPKKIIVVPGRLVNIVV